MQDAISPSVQLHQSIQKTKIRRMDLSFMWKSTCSLHWPESQSLYQTAHEIHIDLRLYRRVMMKYPAWFLWDSLHSNLRKQTLTTQLSRNVASFYITQWYNATQATPTHRSISYEILDLHNLCILYIYNKLLSSSCCLNITFWPVLALKELQSELEVALLGTPPLCPTVLVYEEDNRWLPVSF